MSTTAPQTIESPSTTALWPPDRFYWAEIDGLGWKGHGPLPPGLLLVLADEVPAPLENLHAVGLPAGEGRVVICAISRDTLTGLDPSIVELKPSAVPAGLAPADVDDFNLLVGDCEPPTLRFHRRLWHAHLAFTLLICSLVLTVGLLRRARAADLDAAHAAVFADAVLVDFKAPRHEDVLASQAKTMQAIADAARKAKPSADASVALESLLKVWPTQTSAKPQSLSAGSDGISLALTMEGDPAPLLKSIKVPAGYSLDEPRIATAGPITRVLLHLRPAPGGGR